MDIHKPKSWHGVRAFLKEYATIVVGVLTALAAEQAVVVAHNRLEAADARAAIRGELEFNAARVRSRLDVRACTERRIEEVQAILDGAADHPTIVPPNWIGRPNGWVLQDTRWQAAAQAGHAALIGRDELGSYGLEYARMRQLTLEMDAEQADWAKLRTLEHMRRLEPQAVFDLNATLQDARYRNWRIALSSTQLLDAQQGQGLRQVANPTFASRTICLPITTPRAEALRPAAGRAPSESALGEP